MIFRFWYFTIPSRLLNDAEIAKSKRDFELKKAAYDVEVQTKVSFTMSLSILPFEFEPGFCEANWALFPCIDMDSQVTSCNTHSLLTPSPFDTIYCQINIRYNALKNITEMIIKIITRKLLKFHTKKSRIQLYNTG